jgi:hypothetical protein
VRVCVCGVRERAAAAANPPATSYQHTKPCVVCVIIATAAIHVRQCGGRHVWLGVQMPFGLCELDLTVHDYRIAPTFKSLKRAVQVDAQSRMLGSESKHESNVLANTRLQI